MKSPPAGTASNVRRRGAILAATAAAVLYPLVESWILASFVDNDLTLTLHHLLAPGLEGFVRRLLTMTALVVLGLALDATARRRSTERRLHRVSSDLTASENAARLAAKVFENAVEGILVTDPAGTIVMVNPAFTAITGYSAGEAIGRNPRMLRSDRHDTGFYERMWSSVLATGQWSGEIWNRKKSGEAYPEWLNISAIRNDEGRITNFVAVFHDLSDIKRDQLAIQHQAQHDPLTGLPNRSLLSDRLRVAIAQARRQGGMLAVMFVDLDDFKTVNDTYGHAAGDQLLQHVAGVLRGCVREDDTVARIGGDEFVVVVTALEDTFGAVRVAQCAQHGLTRPLRIGQHTIQVAASIGVTFYPADGASPEILLRNADLAMYRAKELGKSGLQLFVPEMNLRLAERFELESRLRLALAKDRFQLAYQPRYQLSSGHIVGAEALIRWADGDRLLLPEVFLELAEETGLVVSIGERVLEDACRTIRRLDDAGHREQVIVVNLSRRQLGDPELAAKIEGALSRAGVAADRLRLELSCADVMGMDPAQEETLHRIGALGVGIAVDDVGIEALSLAALRRLPISALVVSRELVDGLPFSADARAIIPAIVAVARQLGLKVVAVGVSTPQQLELLREQSCEEVQGFLLSSPLTGDELLAKVAGAVPRRELPTERPADL